MFKVGFPHFPILSLSFPRKPLLSSGEFNFNLWICGCFCLFPLYQNKNEKSLSSCEVTAREKKEVCSSVHSLFPMIDLRRKKLLSFPLFLVLMGPDA